MAKYCTYCGSELNEGAAVCVRCGAMIDGNQNYNNSNQNYSNINQGYNNNNNQNYNNMNQGYNNNQNFNPAAKSKIVAGLLGIFLGSFGVHNFYLGYTGKAVAQLLITILTCGVGAGISGLWGLIEGILILTGSIDRDAKGILLKD